MATVTSNGLQIAYEEYGDVENPVLLMVQGLGMPLTGWSPAIIEALVAEGFRVVIFDNRDIGQSTLLDPMDVPNLLVQILRRILRMTNAFLPAEAAFPSGDEADERVESRVQDVPPLLDSVAEALAFHRERSREGLSDQQWRRWQQDTFALACAAEDWDCAQQVLEVLDGMSALTEAVYATHQRMLAAAKRAADER